MENIKPREFPTKFIIDHQTCFLKSKSYYTNSLLMILNY